MTFGAVSRLFQQPARHNGTTGRNGETGKKRTEDRGRKSEVRRRRTEDRGRKSEVRNQRTKGRRHNLEFGISKSEIKEEDQV
jgi:hypothetical protein